MKTNTSQKILEYIKKNKQASPHELGEYLDITPAALFRHLKKLVAEGHLEKIGQPPKVFYLVPDEVKERVKEGVGYSGTAQLTTEQIQMIEGRYLYVSPFGEMVEGVDGFMQWCRKTKQPIEKTAGEYIATLKKYDRLKCNGLLDGTTKLQQSFHAVYLDRLFYIDFYSIERFGKTKLGQLLLYAKQGQNRELMRQISAQARPIVIKIVQEEKIDAIGFIPPTVKREIQFMSEFEKNLNFKLPTVSIVKVTSDIAVPQKTLTKIEDRIENARKSIVVNEKRQYKNVLLIDDAVGSGATLNETAKKIKEQGVTIEKVIGLSVTGSYKGFDVISEV